MAQRAAEAIELPHHQGIVRLQLVQDLGELDGTGSTVPGKRVDNAPDSNFKYHNLLETLGPLDVGWLACSWYRDECLTRRMLADDGQLTPYGADPVTKRIYALKGGLYKAVRTTLK